MVIDSRLMHAELNLFLAAVLWCEAMMLCPRVCLCVCVCKMDQSFDMACCPRPSSGRSTTWASTDPMPLRLRHLPCCARWPQPPSSALQRLSWKKSRRAWKSSSRTASDVVREATDMSVLSQSEVCSTASSIKSHGACNWIVLVRHHNASQSCTGLADCMLRVP